MAKKRKMKQNFMELVLVHNPERIWTEREDGMVVIDVENKGFHHKIAQKFFHKPKVSHIALDKHGTALWKALDGKRTVLDVICLMEDTFPEEKERMPDRVITFLHTLQVNHFIRTEKAGIP